MLHIRLQSLDFFVHKVEKPNHILFHDQIDNYFNSNSIKSRHIFVLFYFFYSSRWKCHDFRTYSGWAPPVFSPSRIQIYGDRWQQGRNLNAVYSKEMDEASPPSPRMKNLQIWTKTRRFEEHMCYSLLSVKIFSFWREAGGDISENNFTLRKGHQPFCLCPKVSNPSLPPYLRKRKN